MRAASDLGRFNHGGQAVSAMIGCAHCGTAMPIPTGRQARKRYCSELCRKAAWRHRHRDHTTVRDIVEVPPDCRGISYKE